MIITVLFIIFNLINQESLLEQYKQAADKNIFALLGKGELKILEKNSGREYYIFNSENSMKGSIVVFSSAKGRFEYFDYMVIVSSSLEIINIKIFKYRSEYGYEISNKGWLKQFYGKPGILFEYRKDIDALSGATFSAPSLVNDINSILDYLKNKSLVQ